MDEFLKWLRIQMLRLQSFDWGYGSWESNWIREDMVRFKSFYSVETLSKELGLTEDELIIAVASEATKLNVTAKGFQCVLDPNGYKLVLIWHEDAIKTWKTNIDNHYFEKNGQCFQKGSWVEKIIYLDGREREIKRTDFGPQEIARDEFEKAKVMIQKGQSVPTLG